MKLNVPALCGKRVWANPPHKIAGEVLDAIMQAWRMDFSTVDRVDLPVHNEASRFKFYFRRQNRKVHILKVYGSRSLIYLKATSHQDRFPNDWASPIAKPVMVVRIG